MRVYSISYTPSHVHSPYLPIKSDHGLLDRLVMLRPMQRIRTRAHGKPYRLHAQWKQHTVLR